MYGLNNNFNYANEMQRVPSNSPKSRVELDYFFTYNYGKIFLIKK